MECSSRPFGHLSSGAEVTAHTLTNVNGSSVTVLNYGGIIQSLIMPDKDGKLANLVLGYNEVEGYEKLAPYFGCITGRTAGRISGGGFTIDGERFDLDHTEGVNLHGGPVGLDRRLWSVTEVVAEDYAELALSYTSPDGECGFPGNLDMLVTYRLDNEDALTLTYKATTDKATILTLTNHSYFNLSGDPATDILDHEMKLPVDKVLAIGTDAIPVGINEVDGTAFDFRQGKTVGKDIEADEENLINGGGYDHPFVLNKEDGEAIELKDPKSGRKMTVTTSEQCVVIYTGNFLEEVPYVYDQVAIGKRHAICLETQYYPDAINADFLTERILRPGQVYLEETTFKFTAE